MITIEEMDFTLFIGTALMIFSMGVMFATAGFATDFATIIGSDIHDSATGWFIFGAGVVSSGLIYDLTKS